jgi:hypothetical protein
MILIAANREKQENLLNNLQELLEKQIELIRKGDFHSVEALSEQADPLVAEIVKIQLLEQTPLKNRCEHLAKLYKKLELMLATEKELVGRQLRQIGNVRKTLKIYRNNS